MSETPMNKVREFFPGGNTAYGFYSLYDQIIAPDATRIFIIKGGPGVGKSTFMGTIAEEMAGRGFAVELLHCSSDNNSLDGVAFPEIGAALIDGTAPHVVDPKNPGCVDEILHLGDFWNEAGMIRGKEQILAANAEVGRLFARAYRFLRAAKEIRDDWAAVNAPARQPGKLNRLAGEIVWRALGSSPVAAVPGRVRRIFASALTPDGPRHYLPAVFANAQDLIVLRGGPGTGKSTILRKLAQAASERGMMVEAYPCGFDPQRLEHIYLPEPGLGFTTANDYHRWEIKQPVFAADLDEYLDPGQAEKRKLSGYADQEVFADLINRATSLIKEAKKTHDEMEQYYVPHMDFARVSELRERTLKRILGYAERVKAEAG